MTIGGLGSLFAHVVSPSIRGWNRASIFITFSTLAAIAIAVQMLSDKVGRRHRMTIASVAAAGMLVFGIWDQTSAVCGQCQSSARTAYEQDKRFIRSIEAALPVGAAVYQLPYMAFPEVPPKNGLHAYDLAVGFVHSQHLKWSYAGMKGREGDLFYRNLETQPAAAQLQAIGRFGFDAVYIDKRGYADQGAHVIAEWTQAIGAPPAMAREDGAVVVFRLPGVQSLQASRLPRTQRSPSLRQIPASPSRRCAACSHKAGRPTRHGASGPQAQAHRCATVSAQQRSAEQR